MDPQGRLPEAAPGREEPYLGGLGDESPCLPTLAAKGLAGYLYATVISTLLLSLRYYVWGNERGGEVILY